MARGAIAYERDGRILELGIRKRGERPDWMVEDGGKRRRELTKQRWEDRRREENRLEDERALAFRDGLPRERPAWYDSAHAPSYIDDQRAEGRINSPSTVREYRGTLAKHGEDINNRDPDYTNREDVKRTSAAGVTPTRSRRTVRS